jgi:hypothetical protein
MAATDLGFTFVFQDRQAAHHRACPPEIRK